MKSLVSLILVLLFSVTTLAGELKGVKLADNTKLGEKALVLNGMGLRKVYKFGIPIKVYVAGLYLETKNSDSDAILKDKSAKKLVMEFKRSVDRKKLVDAWRKSLKNNCFAECDKDISKERKQFEALNVSVRQGNQMILDFYSDKVAVEVTGPNAKKGEIQGALFSQNLLAVFINKPKPPGKDFRLGLLGTKAK